MNETITVVIGDTNAEYAQAIRRGLEAHGYTVLKAVSYTHLILHFAQADSAALVLLSAGWGRGGGPHQTPVRGRKGTGGEKRRRALCYRS